MKLLLERLYKKEEYTIGKLYIDGIYFCDTLEDKVRIVNNNCDDKVYGRTAIPEGTYSISLIFRGSNGVLTPYLNNVPCFSGILIHSGNHHEHTEGCILVGVNKVKGMVLDSRKTFNELMERFDKEQEKDDFFFEIEIK